MEHEFIIDDERLKILLKEVGEQFVVGVDSKEYKADIKSLTPNIVSIDIDEHIYRVYIAQSKDGFYAQCGGELFFIKDSDQDEDDIQSSEEKSREDMLRVKATMPGKIIKIEVSEKEEVKAGQTLVIVEAMKMENEIRSSINGIVKKIFAAAGDLVDSDKPILELEEKK